MIFHFIVKAVLDLESYCGPHSSARLSCCSCGFHYSKQMNGDVGEEEEAGKSSQQVQIGHTWRFLHGKSGSHILSNLFQKLHFALVVLEQSSKELCFVSSRVNTVECSARK